jgi:hypothetical protein
VRKNNPAPCGGDWRSLSFSIWVGQVKREIAMVEMFRDVVAAGEPYLCGRVLLRG